MKHGYLDNTPLAEAVKGYLAFLRDHGLSPKEETVPTAAALDRVTARAVYARACSPRCNACAMDGVALSAAVTFGATQAAPVTLAGGSYIRVDAGDPLPDGCDAVVAAEDLAEGEEGRLRLYAPAAPWQQVWQVGEDVSAGDMILSSYETVEPAGIGALLAGGVPEVPVLKKPRVGIIPTGDGTERNSAIFSGMAVKWGAEPAAYPIVRDDPELIGAALQKAAMECDVVLLCAGASAGRDDGAAAVIERLGEVKYHGIALKPGKPAVLGRVGQTPVIGVPGYPVSGIVVLSELVKPVVDALLMRPREYPEHVCVSMGRKLTSSPKYREFVRATLGLGKDGILTALPLNRGAGVVTSFVKADCLLDVPQSSSGYEAGDRASAILLKPISRVGGAVRILGSHDPLLDEAADLLRRRDPDRFVTSVHAGSVEGILAVKRGEAQIGGVCLPDEGDGSYNVSYIETYIPEGGVVLVECAQRMQGLMVKKGNPKGIRALADLMNPELTYVNRQRGSGTRMLCDYLLRQNGLPPDRLRGRGREALTHAAVAARIAGDTADCGLGILAAARMYGLDFIPVCTEQYDLIVSLSAMENPAVQAYLQVLQTAEFADRLRRMGGYELDQPGRIRKLWMER